MEYSRNPYYFKRQARLQRRNEILAEGVIGLANIAAGALVFGELVSEGLGGKIYFGVILF